MKKQSSILLCLALLFSLLSACGSEAIPSSASEEPTEQTQAPAPDTGDATDISLSGSGASVSGSGAAAQDGVVTISEDGTYALSGTLADGRIVVNAPGAEVTLLLQNADITCSYGSPLYVYKAACVTVYLAADSQNVLTDGESYTFDDALSSASDEEPNACLYSKADLILAGTGSLTVNANYKNGITCKDTLCIEQATLHVTAKNHGINGKDSCTVTDATVCVVSGGDALRSTNDTDASLGFIRITDSDLTLTSGEDGIQAETALTISGGSCTIVAGGGSSASLAQDASAKGLKSGVSLLVSGGEFLLDCADDAVHTNGDAEISGGSFSISTGDDGIHADGSTRISGGSIDIAKCYEGVEGTAVEITGGEIRIVSSDDGINAAGGADQSGFGPRQDSFTGGSACYIDISGGTIYIDASGDGLDSNGTLNVSGGEIYIDGPTSDGDGALDYDGTGTITGGTLVAVGANGMAMNFGADSTQGSILLNLSGSAGQTVTVRDSSGSVLLSYTPAKDYRSVVVSCPGLTQGETYTVSAGTQEATVTLDTLIYGGGMGGGQSGRPGTPPDGGNGNPPSGQPGGQRP